MFEELKKKALKSTLAWSIILIIGGVVLAGWNAMDAFYSVQEAWISRPWDTKSSEARL